MNTKEQEVLQVIDNLKANLKLAEKTLEEIRKPKRAPLKHGDIGHTRNNRSDRRLFIYTPAGIVGYGETLGHVAGVNDVKSYHEKFGYVITGNAFE